MKSYTPLIIAFLLGAWVVAAGWGGAIVGLVILFGLVVLVLLAALIWTSLDSGKHKRNEQLKSATDQENDV